MLIPATLRKQLINGLHAAHQGVSGMKANARDRFFWPGLDADIKQCREQCRMCNEIAPSQPDEPLIMTPPPTLPFQQTVTDLFHAAGHEFLIYADRYTGWTEVSNVAHSYNKCIKKKCRSGSRHLGLL